MSKGRKKTTNQRSLIHTLSCATSVYLEVPLIFSLSHTELTTLHMNVNELQVKEAQEGRERAMDGGITFILLTGHRRSSLDQ